VLESVDPDDAESLAVSVERLWPWLVQDWLDEFGALPVGRMVVAVLPLDHPCALDFVREHPGALEVQSLRYPMLPVVAVDLTDDVMLPDALVHTVLDPGTTGDEVEVVAPTG
jgi:hypothetical protein